MGAALKPLLEQAALFQPHKNPVRTQFHGIGFEDIAPAIHVPAVFQVEFELMHRADDLAAAGHIGVDHRGAGMGAGVGKAKPAVLPFRNADLFAIDRYFGDVPGGPFDIGLLIGDLVPFVFFETHPLCYLCFLKLIIPFAIPEARYSVYDFWSLLCHHWFPTPAIPFLFPETRHAPLRFPNPIRTKIRIYMDNGSYITPAPFPGSSPASRQYFAVPSRKRRHIDRLSPAPTAPLTHSSTPA